MSDLFIGGSGKDELLGVFQHIFYISYQSMFSTVFPGPLGSINEQQIRPIFSPSLQPLFPITTTIAGGPTVISKNTTIFTTSPISTAMSNNFVEGVAQLKVLSTDISTVPLIDYAQSVVLPPSVVLVSTLSISKLASATVVSDLAVLNRDNSLLGAIASQPPPLLSAQPVEKLPVTKYLSDLCMCVYAVMIFLMLASSYGDNFLQSIGHIVQWSHASLSLLCHN